MAAWIASLPQYDLPELRAVTDDWWRGLTRHLRRHGISEVPDELTRTDDDEAVWRDPNILVTQTCGYPLMTELKEYLRPVVTPVYRCEGCIGGTYSSALIIRDASEINTLEDLRGKKAAINNWNSHSGMNALRLTIAPLAWEGRFFGDVVLSGGHVKSVDAVRDGLADVAAIDSVTWALLGQECPSAREGVKVLMWTRDAPSLPYAIRANADEELFNRVQVALLEAGIDPDLSEQRERLLINGFEPCSLDTYHAMIDFEMTARTSGYPTLN